MRRKKIAVGIVFLMVVALAAALLLIGFQSAGTGFDGDASSSEKTTEEKQPLADRTEKESFNQVQREKLEQIIENTYIYYDEFLEGKPITYTFYENGTMAAYYWEDTETDSIPLSSQWVKYSVNDDVTEITLDWDDGTKTTESFKVKRGCIIIGKTEFQLSDRDIHLN